MNLSLSYCSALINSYGQFNSKSCSSRSIVEVSKLKCLNFFVFY